MESPQTMNEETSVANILNLYPNFPSFGKLLDLTSSFRSLPGFLTETVHSLATLSVTLPK